MALTPAQKSKLARLRKKETLSEGESAEMETLLSLRGKRGRKPRAEAKTTESPLSSEPVTTEAPSEPKTTKPPTPKPPKMEEPSAGTSKDWRDQYRQSVGREAACVEIAGIWCAGLKRLSKYVADSGDTPIFDDETIDTAIYPACVLTADKYLPQGVEPGPEVTVAIGSSIAIGQAFVVSRKVKKAKAKQEKDSKIHTEVNVVYEDPEFKAENNATDTDEGKPQGLTVMPLKEKPVSIY